MSHESKSKTLSGHLDQILFSPKGGVEGLLMTVADEPLQISMPSTAANAETLSRAVGQTIEVKAAADHSPKTKHGAHPVYKLETITKIAGRAFKPSSAHDQIKGVVAAIHYAKHGEPNGVILKSGEFIHTRPHGMKKLKLKVGSKVTASGELRMTVLGTSLIEAHEVNRVSME
jgi:hypothetical protein